MPVGKSYHLPCVRQPDVVHLIGDAKSEEIVYILCSARRRIQLSVTLTDSSYVVDLLLSWGQRAVFPLPVVQGSKRLS